MTRIPKSTMDQTAAIRDYLHEYLEQPKNENTMNALIADIGEHFRGDRAYIFEVDEERQVMVNTYEWCREGVKSEKEKLQNVPVNILSDWFEEFAKKNELSIPNLEEKYPHDSAQYKLLADQGIHSLIAAPMLIGGKTVGYIGVDNPTLHKEDLLLLSVIASTCYIEITNKRIMDKRDKKTKEQSEEKQSIILSLSKFYAAVHYIHIDTNTFSELYSVDVIRKQIGMSGPAQERLNYLAEKLTAPEYAEAMKRFVDLSTINERMGELHIVTTQFLSTFRYSPESEQIWCECALIDGGRDENGKLTHVILTNRSIHGEKMKELEHRAALEKAYREATAAAEQAEKATRAKTMFLANMSHDIRTPMNAIVGITELMAKESGLSNKMRDYIGKITSSSEYLLGLINNVLDMSKIESGEVHLAKESVSMAEELGVIESIIRPRIAEKGQDFQINIINVAHEYHIGDSVRLRQILVNLLTNAVKYTPYGGTIRMIISELPCDKPDYCTMSVAVIDNGRGMSKEYQKHLYEPFSRAEETITNRVQGTGLGMAITKTIVDMLGGAINVDSELGKGTKIEVVLTLPIDHSVESTANSDTILFISNEERFAENMNDMASVNDVNIMVVKAVQEAVELLKTHKVDAVMLEGLLHDPSLNEYVRSIRKVVGTNTFIFCTDYTDLESAHEILENADVDGLLPRPFFISQIANIIDRARNKAVSDEQESRLKGMNFLCAEDNELNAIILKEILAFHEANCYICNNGEEIVKYFETVKEGEYDAILMDIQMPFMNGLDATKAIRHGSNPLGKTIPIIAMTANAFSEDVQNCLDAGMNAHLSKPIDISSLERIVRKEVPHPHK